MFDQRDLAGRRIVAAPPGRNCEFGWLIKPWFILVFCILGLSPAAGQDLGYESVLGPGAKARVTLFGHDDLSGELEIDGSGKVTLPLVRDMLVHDRSLDNLERLFVAAFEPDCSRNPEFNVEIVNCRPLYLNEEVANSGSCSYCAGAVRANDAAATTGDVA